MKELRKERILRRKVLTSCQYGMHNWMRFAHGSMFDSGYWSRILHNLCIVEAQYVLSRNGFVEA